MNNETFEKTKRNPLEIVITIIIAFIIWSIPVAILISNANRDEAKKVASVDSVFSICWKEVLRMRDENYSYVILYPSNEDFTEIQGYVKDIDLENTELTFHEAIVDSNVNEYLNGNRTYTIKAENIAKMYAYKNDRLVKMVKTVEK